MLGVVWLVIASMLCQTAVGLAGWTTFAQYTTPGTSSFSTPATVPLGIMRVKAWGGGGGGGSGSGAVGGAGAFIDYQYTSISTSTPMTVWVGGGGGAASPSATATGGTGAGFGGNGRPNGGGGGGGASEVRRTTPTTRTLVAGGGGGGSHGSGGGAGKQGGAAGCNTGTNGGGSIYNSDLSAGTGGSQTQGGVCSTEVNQGLGGGVTGGGPTQGQGGNGGFMSGQYGGGGGGGGLCGGGGGSYSSNTNGGGGGGGSSVPTTAGVCFATTTAVASGTSDEFYSAGLSVGGAVNTAGGNGKVVVLFDIDECATGVHTCANAGACTNLAGSYSCSSCLSGYAGTRCQSDINECASAPCVSGQGTCVDLVAGWSCTCGSGYAGTRCQTNINECASTPCVFGNCFDFVAQYACQCLAGYSGLNCQTEINECASSPCTNGGTCTDLVAGYTCACIPGYSGGRCQTNVNECACGPCINGGTCTDGIDSYSCACKAGFSGARCQTDVNECASSPCQFGTCVDSVARFSCTCSTGYSGVLCQTNINECASNPCSFASTCTDAIGAYVCSCPPGITGVSCQSNLDECASAPCVNGGTCVDAINAFSCACAPGYSGRLCETNINECASLPCVNGGTCSDQLNSFACTCVTGYSGLQCQTNINECGSTPCQNGGTCTDLLGVFTCACPAGYSGSLCQTNINECASTPCRNGGTCSDLVNAFTCACPGGYSGGLCQTEVNECASAPCVNGGSCADRVNGFACTCPSGYSGLFCQTNINECASNPCYFGGSCTDDVARFSCTCAAGYSGLFCQTNVNECASQPCTNGGTCTDLTAAFTCACVPGYSGARCQTNINECASTPCRNTGTCVDAIAKFTCVCAAGYSGLVCQTDVDECASNPCEHGGSCHDAANQFTCSCVAGYSGLQCQTNVNECSSQPCRNGGTCADGINYFTCTCRPGYSGLTCQTDVNECASQPCQNGGSCSDLVNAFTCVCAAGYSGATCQTNINECASTPCKNGGTCSDLINAFACACPAGYSGERCQTDINECGSNPCQNGGSCTDHVNRFTCQCTVFFTDSICSTDVNECARPDYGGCPPAFSSYCYNTYGSWSCLYVEGGLTTASGVTTTDASPLVLLGTSTRTSTYLNFTFVTAPAVLRLAPTDVHPSPINAIQGLTLWIGNANGARVACTAVLEQDATVAMSRHKMSCITPPWFGINHILLMNNTLSTPVVLAATNHSFKYPDPKIRVFTLRLNETDTPKGALTLLDGDPTRVVFEGTDFGPPGSDNPTRVYYGGTANPYQYSCALDTARTTDSLISCYTELGSNGVGLRFLVVVGAGTSERSVDVMNQPAIPIVSRVSGCVDVQNSTTLCPTEGGTVLTIYGQNIVQLDLQVFLGGALCINPQADRNDTGLFLTCTLPVGAGLDISVSMSCAGRPAKRPVLKGLSYSPPIVTAIRGCTWPVYDPFTGVADNLTISDCSRDGGNLITLIGSNFGVSDAFVLVGTDIGADVHHSSLTPHRQLTFVSPRGTNIRSVVVIQSGTIQPSPAQVGYHKCNPGEFQSGLQLECVPCDSFSFSSQPDAFGCDHCPSGLIPKLPNELHPQAGASTCIDCAAGRYALGGHANCTDCAPGTAQPTSHSSSCDVCVAGRYSNSTRSEKCVECPIQTRSQSPGSTSCEACAGILNQPARGQTYCSLCLTGTFYSRARGGCETCGTGIVCNSSGIFGDGAHYVYYDGGRDSIVALPCLQGFCSSCPKFPQERTPIMYDPDTNQTIVNPSFFPLVDGQTFSCCSANRIDPATNNLCGQCNPGYYVWGDSCVLCDKANAKVITLFVFTTWIYVLIFYRLAQISRADTRIFINFFQFVLIFLQTRAGGLVAWLSVFNVNVFQTSGSTCVAPLSPLASLASGLFIPVVGFGFLFLNALIHYGMWRCLRAKRCDDRCWYHVGQITDATDSAPATTLPVPPKVTIRTVWISFWFELRMKSQFSPVWNTYRRTFLAFLNSSYPSIAQTVFTFFNCVDSNGDTILLPYPSVSCRHSPEYLAAQPIFYILLILVCAYPVLLFARLYQLQSHHLLFQNPEIKFVYGSMHEAYPTTLYYWEVWVLIRRLTIAAVAQIVEPLNLPLKFTWLTFLGVMFLFVHFLKRPYVLFMDNYFESLSLVVLALITLFLIAAENPLQASTALGLSAMAFVVGAILFSRIILSRYEAYLLKNRVPLNARYSTDNATKEGTTKRVTPTVSPKSKGTRAAATAGGTRATTNESKRSRGGGKPLSPTASAGTGMVAIAVPATKEESAPSPVVESAMLALPVPAPESAPVSDPVPSAGAELSVASQRRDVVSTAVPDSVAVAEPEPESAVPLPLTPATATAAALSVPVAGAVELPRDPPPPPELAEAAAAASGDKPDGDSGEPDVTTPASD